MCDLICCYLWLLPFVVWCKTQYNILISDGISIYNYIGLVYTLAETAIPVQDVKTHGTGVCLTAHYCLDMRMCSIVARVPKYSTE